MALHCVPVLWLNTKAVLNKASLDASGAGIMVKFTKSTMLLLDSLTKVDSKIWSTILTYLGSLLQKIQKMFVNNFGTVTNSANDIS